MKRRILYLLVLVLFLAPALVWTVVQAQGPDGQIDDLTPALARPAGKGDDSDNCRIPPVYVQASGGPDAFGYTYRDSDGAGCRYDWIEIAGTGTDLGLNGDDVGAPVPLGFAFPFYADRYDTVSVSSNGYLSFGPSWVDYAEVALPSALRQGRIAVLWDDQEIVRAEGDAVYVQRFDSPGGAFWVVEFVLRDLDAPPSNGDTYWGTNKGPYRYQAILYQNGDLKFQYDDLGVSPAGSGQSAMVGIEDGSGGAGLGYLFHRYPSENALHDGLAVCIRYPDGAYLSPGWQAGYARAGRVASYELLAVNQTGVSQDFGLSVEDAAWPVVVEPDRATIPAGEALPITVRVTVPPGMLGQQDTAVLRMAALADPTIISNLARLETVAVSGQYGYTGASSSDEAAVFDLGTWTLVDRLDLLPEGDYPYDATMKPDGSEVWIPGAVGDGVVVIDTASNQVTQRIAVGEYPVGVAFCQDSAYALVSNRDTEDITIIDTSSYTVVDTIPVPTYYLGAGGLALNPINGDLYVLDWYDDHFWILDSETFIVTREITLGSSLWQLVVHPEGGLLYITDRGQDVVHVLDTATMAVTATIPVGDDPWGIDITPDGALIYVTNEDSHNVTVIDATDNTVITTISLPHADADPRDVDFSSDGVYAYVTSGAVTGNDQVYVIDASTHAVVGQVDVAPAGNPNVVAVAPQMAVGGGVVQAGKWAWPEPVVLGDPLTYTIDFAYWDITPTMALVTDSLPVGTAYLSSTGGLSSSYDIVEHRVIWSLGSVTSTGQGVLGLVVLPLDGPLIGQPMVNRADLDFGVFTATAWVSSTVLTPELSIRLPGGTLPPDPLFLCASEGVSLTAHSNRAGPLLYAWDLGDGSLASTPVVSHSWDYGAYTVRLSTTNDYGWVETATLALQVGQPPAADWSSNSPVLLGRPALFTDTTAYDPTAWSWDFGDDAGTSDQQHPIYTYTAPGSYTVTLAVSNVCGVDLYAAPFVVIDPCRPVEAISISGPLALEVGQAGLYTATYAPPDATPTVTLVWDDGIVGPAMVYSWTQAGDYTLTVTATNPCSVLSATFAVEVWCQQVEQVVITGPLALEVGQVGLFTATFAPPSVTQPLAWTWDNGGIGPSAAYSWTLPGTYTLTVTATNPCSVLSATFVVEVWCQQVEQVVITGPLALEIGQVGLFTATFAPPSATQPLAWTWDNGGIGPSAAYSWTLPGTYTLTVTATNPCSVLSATFAVEVWCQQVEQVVITGPLVLEIGQVGLFTATFAPPSATQPLAWTWDNGGIGPSAAYSWTLPGTYTLGVTATNPCGGRVGVRAIEVRPLEYRIYLPLVMRGGSR